MSWKTIKLGDAATFVNGYPFKPQDWNGNGQEIIRIQNLTGSTSEINYFEGELDEKYKIRKGDLLISWSATLGIYEWNKDDGWLNQHIFKVIFNKHQFEKKFFKYLISNELEAISREVHGSTMKHITKKRFDDIPISIPPLEMQRKIASILDAADDYRQKTRALIEKYDQLAQSLFLDMFGDPVKNPKNFKIVKLKEVTTKITDGVHAKPNYLDSGVPFISVKDITSGTLKFNDCKFISKPDHIKFIKRCSPEYMDILYTKVGATYGRPAIVDSKKEFSIYVSIALIKPDHSKINPYFLKDVLANPAIKRQADKSIKGIGVPDLHLNMIKEFLIPLPDFHLQNNFANRIQAIELQKQIAEKNFQKSEELFNSLLQKAFKGELV